MALFAGLSAPRRAWLVRRTNRVQVPRRRALWTAGEPAELIYLVRSGVVGVHLDLDGDRRRTLAFRGRGAVVGEQEALEGLGGPTVRRTTAVAHDELAAFGVPIAALVDLIDGTPRLALALAQLVAHRAGAIALRFAAQPHRTAKARLCTALLHLATEFGVRDSRGTIVNLRLTHREFADLVGTTRETVSQALSQLRASGLIQSEGKRVVLLDLPALEALAQS